MLHHEAVRLGLVSSYGNHFRDPPMLSIPSNMHDEVNRQRNRLSDTAVWKSDRSGHHTVRKTHERLLGRVAVDRRHTSEVAGVQRLQQMGRTPPPDFANDDPDKGVAGWRGQVRRS